MSGSVGVLVDWMCCSCELERLDKAVGMYVKGRGTMSFLYPSPDVYPCLKCLGRALGF